ncbi:MAG: efflux RND transporter periplasmic adaptor subunit [Burkholderiales bacterium]
MARRVALCLTLVTGLLLGCSKPGPDSTGSSAAAGKSAAEVKIGEASRQFLTIEAVGATSSSGTRTYFGRTAFRPKALAAVTAPFAGRVAEVLVEPGQRVRAGAPLFALESADVLQARANLEQARLRARLAQEMLARQDEMAKRGVGLEVERFEAEMKARETDSELKRAERSAALAGPGEGTRLEVRSPTEGIVVTVKVTRGATVPSGGEPLVEIGNLGGLWVVADVPENEIGMVSKATKAQVEISALNVSLAGHLAGVAPRSDPETRRTPFYVELERAPADLRAGLLVRVSVFAPGREGEIWLPVTAVLLKDGGKRVVYVEAEPGKFVPREIEVTDERGGKVRVLKGLQAGERAVMRGALLVDREAEQLL